MSTGQTAGSPATPVRSAPADRSRGAGTGGAAIAGVAAGEAAERVPDIDLAEELGIRTAKPWIRSLAFVVDLLVWVLLVSPAFIGAWLVLEQGPRFWPQVLVIAGSVLAGVFGLVQLILHGRRGVTVGKAAMKLRSVSVPGLSRPGFWRILLRALVLWLSNALPSAGPVLLFSSGYWDSSGRQRSLLDRVGGCWLIDVKDGLDPTNLNELRRARRGYDARFRDTSEHLPSLATARPRAPASAPDAPPAFLTGPGAPGIPAATGLAAAAAARNAEPAPTIDLSAERSSASVVGAARERWVTQKDRIEHEPTDSARANEVWMFVFDDGSWITVTSFGLIGRAPEQQPGRAIGQLVAIDDTHRLLADTHLAFGADEYGVWVEDLGSPGGSEVLEPGQRQTQRLGAGSAVRIGEGAIVELGGRGFRVQREELRA